jgi:putative SOS response-associated peptidase YedK
MCGRYTLSREVDALLDRFGVEHLSFAADEWRPSYNIAPTRLVPVVRQGDAGAEMILARWGLVPRWSSQPKTRYSTINARAETVASKPTYREAFRRRRCLVLADGFYEWQRAGPTKVPHYIRMPDRSPFAFAGLWEHWDREPPVFDSCAIVVTEANAAMRPVHDRMPVILSPAQYGTWLDRSNTDVASLERLLQPFTGALDIYPVAARVNSPRNDDASLIARSQQAGGGHSSPTQG